MQLQPAPNPIGKSASRPQNNDIVASQSANSLGNLLGSVLFDQAGNRRRQLGAVFLPVGQAIDSDTEDSALPEATGL